MKLTNEQAEILAHCSMCQIELEVEPVKAALEAGEQVPGTLWCPRCSSDSAYLMNATAELASTKAAELAAARTEAAGLTGHFQQSADELRLRQANRQN